MSSWWLMAFSSLWKLSEKAMFILGKDLEHRKAACGIQLQQKGYNLKAETEPLKICLKVRCPVVWCHVCRKTSPKQKELDWVRMYSVYECNSIGHRPFFLYSCEKNKGCLLCFEFEWCYEQVYRMFLSYKYQLNNVLKWKISIKHEFFQIYLIVKIFV